MRTLDLTPLYRSTIGFDRLAGLMDQALAGEDRAPAYPPYDIVKIDDDSYRISIAVAGFADSELSIEAKGEDLTIRGEKAKSDKDAEYLYRGIAGRDFERRFRLADHVKVVGASLEHGLLNVDLARETPEALKPRRIEIANGERAAAPRTIESAAA